MSHKCIFQMWQSRNDGPCPLASSPLFEHPVNHIVRRGDFLSLPRRSHLPPPPPFRPLACRSPAAAPRRLLRHCRHPIRRIRPYAYAKSFPPSGLPPSLLHWPLAVELLSAGGRIYAYKCVFAASPRKRPSLGGVAGRSVRSPPSPPRRAQPTSLRLPSATPLLCSLRA